jgi:hypothetical protein
VTEKLTAEDVGVFHGQVVDFLLRFVSVEKGSDLEQPVGLLVAYELAKMMRSIHQYAKDLQVAEALQDLDEGEAEEFLKKASGA